MAPESALADLRLRAETDPTFKDRSRQSLQKRLEFERELLVVWAREKGIAVPAEEYLTRSDLTTRGEHHVFFDAEGVLARDRFLKITHGVEPVDAGFALTVDTNFCLGKKTQRYIGVPYLRDATPFEYLARLRLFNLTFRDFIELEAVIDDAGQEAIIVSQEYIHGHAATGEEVMQFMGQRGFAPIRGVTAGRRHSTSYFRERDQVAVFDTHGENFIISGPRMVPIDALIVYADADLTTFLSMPEKERFAEVGQWVSPISSESAN